MITRALETLPRIHCALGIPSRRPARHPKVALAVFVGAVLLGSTSCSGGPATKSAPGLSPGGAGIRATLVASGLSQPLDLTAPPGDTARVFIVEKTGAIRILRQGAVLPTPFLDISSRVSSGTEQGLLGLAFHPQYAANGKLYVNYTDLAGDTHIVEFTASADLDRASSTGRELLFVHQPYANHNGGGLAFGPDGYLYIGLGDGGSGGDPGGRAQNPDSLLGKLLRINVNSTDPAAGTEYVIPPDNPFRGRTGYRPEIWDLGLRNPWRFSFDPATGDLYIGDVGQNLWEEVDVEPHGSGGRNYGWNIMEGNHCYGAASCDATGLTRPAVEYGHGQGCSVTGGCVYRGTAIPALAGAYFYGDYCSGSVRSFRIAAGVVADKRDWSGSLRRASGGAMSGLSSFGRDARGDLYILLLGGEVYRIDPAP